MKYTYLLLTACLVYLFTACEPKFDLNAPYKDITVVYGILDSSLDTNYVKIYKGFQSRDGQTYINAKIPDSIYYQKINVELEEYINGVKTKNIKMSPTNNFPRDTGIFYYEDERIIYYTDTVLSPDAEYKIIITNRDNNNRKVTTAITPIVGTFQMKGASLQRRYNMTGTSSSIEYDVAKNAFDYEIHVNFLYFEVDSDGKITQYRVRKNITPHLGTSWGTASIVQSFTNTFFEDIASQVQPNNRVRRYIGTPESDNCLEFEAWAAEENMVRFLMSNKPSSSFVQVNTLFTNIETEDNTAFGFFSSRSQARTEIVKVTPASHDSIVYGSKTRHLGFRKWVDDYKPN